MKRRDVLIAAASLAPGVVAGAATLARSGADASVKRLKIIVAGGHPGDPEYGCGGTVAHLTAMGHDVVLLYLNDGAWPPTPANVRLAEAQKACELLHARPAYANQINGHAVVDNAQYGAFQKLVEAENPDAVFCQWPLDNHRDHRAISMLSYDAWTQSGRKFALYYYEVSDGEDTMQFSPNLFVDITVTAAVKRAACYAHASQTPDRYYELQDTVAKFRGIQSGYERAEAFIRQVQSPYDIFQRAALPTR